MRYLEGSGDVAGARAALQRATLVHCKAQPDIHIFSALFEERHGDVEAARAEYALVQVSQGSLTVLQATAYVLLTHALFSPAN